MRPTISGTHSDLTFRPRLKSPAEQACARRMRLGGLVPAGLRSRNITADDVNHRILTMAIFDFGTFTDGTSAALTPTLQITLI